MLIVHGGSRLSLDLFTELPPAGFEMGGGFGNAIVGTVVMVRIAAVISVPIGVLAAVYLAELGPDSQLGRVSRFLAKVLTGFPSILAGVFVYAVIVLAMGRLLGHRGRRRARDPHAAHGGADGRGSDEDGAAQDEGRGARHGLHPHPGDLEDRFADGAARHPDRRDARCRARRRRIGAAAVHRPVQQLLAAAAWASRPRRWRS